MLEHLLDGHDDVCSTLLDRMEVCICKNSSYNLGSLK